MVYLNCLLFHFRYKVHRLRKSFSDQLQSRIFYLKSQTLGSCLAFDVQHIHIHPHAHHCLESQKVKLPNREGEEDLPKGLRWFFHIFTIYFIGVPSCPNLFYQYRKDQCIHASSSLPLAYCHCSASLLFQLSSSSTLEDIKSTTLHFGMVETLPGQQFKFFHLLAGSVNLFC